MKKIGAKFQQQHISALAWVLFLGVTLLGTGVKAYAAETFEYPELSVTPRASERLESEARKEYDRRWTTYLPFQASALATLVAGVVQGGNLDPSKDSAGNSQLAGLLVGGGWLGITTAMIFWDEPYGAAAHEVSVAPRKSVREQLTRERMAEEAIQKRARLGRTLKWLSVGSHVFANAMMLSRANDFAKTFDGIALVASLAPVIFPLHWQEIADEQADYKKRIYAPVAQLSVLQEPGNKSYAPGLTLSFRF